MRILMLVATPVANDARVLREATTLADAGHSVHIVGRAVPPEFTPPAGVTVSGVGASSVLRPEGSQSLGGRKLALPVRAARWALLPTHRQSSFRRWAAGAVADARDRDFDVVHAHDFTALAPAAELASRHGVGYVYDAHEYWSGMARAYRPTPLLDMRERHLEAELGGRALGRITIGSGLAAQLRRTYGWPDVTVVRNTFPPLSEPMPLPASPTGFLYAGRLGAHRDLEMLARASHDSPRPIRLMGPVDATWLGGFDSGAAEILPPVEASEVDRALAASGCALVTLAHAGRNHLLAQPNKLFQAIRVGVPLIASEIGELGETVRRYNLGTLYRPGDAASFLAAAGRLVASYDRHVSAVGQAQPEMSWPADAKRLIALYDRIGN